MTKRTLPPLREIYKLVGFCRMFYVFQKDELVVESSNKITLRDTKGNDRPFRVVLNMMPCLVSLQAQVFIDKFSAQCLSITNFILDIITEHDYTDPWLNHESRTRFGLMTNHGLILSNNGSQ